MSPTPHLVLVSTAAMLSAVAAIASAVTAAIAGRLQRQWGGSDAFIRISDRLETVEFRQYRRTIYGLDRAAFAQWSEQERAAVDAWCAQIDLVSALVQSRQIAVRPFLDMYGDVTLRTIYQIAPYCNAQANTRGPQFLLPTRTFTGQLVKLWRAEARRKRYPLTIGFPALAHVRMNPDLFDSDQELLRFRQLGRG